MKSKRTEQENAMLLMSRYHGARISKSPRNGCYGSDDGYKEIVELAARIVPGSRTQEAVEIVAYLAEYGTGHPLFDLYISTLHNENRIRPVRNVA